MERDDAQRLLDRIGVLRHPCDLDLLLFFARHPRSLLTSEHLTTLLGYEQKQIADSLEILLEAGFLTRMQNPTHAARLYVFDVAGTSGDWVPRLLELASTRQGKLVLRERLSVGKRSERGGTAHAPRASVGMRGPRPVMVQGKSDAASRTKVG